jgi:hypothetical protein
MTRVILLLCCALGGWACSTISPGTTTTPLAQYAKQNDYRPLKPPRTEDGVGTVVHFKMRHESLVTGPLDTPTCLAEVPRQERSVVLLDREYRIDQTAGLELGIGAVKQVNLSAAFNDSRVKGASVRLKQPFEEVISEVTLRRYFDQLPSDHFCREVLCTPQNRLIIQVLGVKGFEINFLSESGSTVPIDQNLLHYMSGNASVKWDRRVVERDSVVIDFPVIIGARYIEPAAVLPCRKIR